MKKQNSKKQKKWEVEDQKFGESNVKKIKRHSSKENLKDIVQGNIDYDEYMEMEDWSDSR
jgi:hypothetical protein